jgi:hypothetical protein
VKDEICNYNQVILINFLNGIENICYLCNKNYISSDDVEEFFEHELPYFLDVFEAYIKYAQELYDSNHDNEPYSEFNHLVAKIRCKK